MSRSFITTATTALCLASHALAIALPSASATGTGTQATTMPPNATLVGASNPTVTPAPEASALRIDAAQIDTPPEYLTISIVNSYGSAISTSGYYDPNYSSAVSGDTGAGTMAAGATAAFAVPTSWIGNVAIADAAYAISGDDTLIEANFQVPVGYDVAVASVDISYVDGFSVPVTCSCDNTVVTGCNQDLFDLNTCDDNDGEGACVNPLRSDETATAASTFFAPCEGAAWTYVNDGDADSFGECQSGIITCCVGTSCAANPNQPVGA